MSPAMGYPAGLERLALRGAGLKGVSGSSGGISIPASVEGPPGRSLSPADNRSGNSRYNARMGLSCSPSRPGSPLIKGQSDGFHSRPCSPEVVPRGYSSPRTSQQILRAPRESDGSRSADGIAPREAEGRLVLDGRARRDSESSSPGDEDRAGLEEKHRYHEPDNELKEDTSDSILYASLSRALSSSLSREFSRENGNYKIAPSNFESFSSTSSSRWIAPTEQNRETSEVASVGVQSVQIPGEPVSSIPQVSWNVMGLGQAMVDISACVGDDFLDRFGLIKGTREVIDYKKLMEVKRALDGCNLTAGGSLSNTLVALARLGDGHNGEPALRVALTGSVGNDLLGGFYRGQLREAEVSFLSDPMDEATTGTVIVCTTPDAQRTMLSYQGKSSEIKFDEVLMTHISRSKYFIIEGYLWELPSTVEAIETACKWARQAGVTVALTASDISCVNRHRQRMWDVLVDCTDILFANVDEARALLGADSNLSSYEVTMKLSLFCNLVSVTDGADGSYIGYGSGSVAYIPPAECIPVDTCGAGDAYAAGILYGLSQSWNDYRTVGNFAAKVAAVVVGQQGPLLSKNDARKLAASTWVCRDENDICRHGTVLSNIEEN